MRVVGVGTAVPDGALEQAEAAEVSVPLVGADGRKSKLLRGLFRRSGVDRRHSVLVQGRQPGGSVQDFYPPRQGESDGGPGTAARMQRYQAHAGELAAQAARRALDGAALDGARISHLITVSCTGFYAPGVDIDLIARLGLATDVQRTHVGFMGCHGMFNALAVARAIVRAESGARVLVVAVELCSLHFHYGWHAERLVANSLFADGAGAIVCSGGDAPAARMRVDAVGSLLLPDSADAMTWRIGDHGFEMTLDATVPIVIQRHVAGWLSEWLAPQGLALNDIATWAVHPGGPRVLSAFEDAVGLRRGELVASRAVLARYGNMSSATIVFILEHLLEHGAPAPGVAVGFGPGMIAEAFLFHTLTTGC